MHAPAAAPPEIDGAADWLEENSSGDVVLTPDGVLLEYNRAAARMFRLAPGEDAHGLNILGLCTNVPRFHDAIRALEVTGRLENWDCDFVRFDGTPLHAICNLIGNFDNDRQLASIRAHLFNITEWRKLQQRSADSERLEAIGRLAGGIAHDYNNLLMIISGHADLLAAHADPSVARSAGAIHDAARRATTVTKQLLAFGRREVLRAQSVDLNAVAVMVQADIRRTFGRRVHVELSLGQGLWPVRVDPKHFEEAIGTLAGYAIDTMDQDGAISLRTSNVELTESALSQPWMRPGTFVKLEIAHTGRPLDRITRARLFEPFDEPNADSRIGLAAVYGLIKQSGGHIWIDETQPDGTVYTILMPALERRAPAAGDVAAAAGRPMRGHGETILLVDDEGDVRMLIGQTLRGHGYTVVEAATVKEAMQVFEMHRDAVQVLIADVALARGTGIELAAALTELAPDLRVLLMSGYAEHATAAGRWSERGDFLDKPFTHHQLMERVTRLLRVR
jgi:signal transduction histidine kinase/CheY-like chemotaxis protein